MHLGPYSGRDGLCTRQASFTEPILLCSCLHYRMASRCIKLKQYSSIYIKAIGRIPRHHSSKKVPIHHHQVQASEATAGHVSQTWTACGCHV
jgi:hypothetical protein